VFVRITNAMYLSPCVRITNALYFRPCARITNALYFSPCVRITNALYFSPCVRITNALYYSPCVRITNSLYFSSCVLKRIRHKFYQLMKSSPIYTVINIIILCWDCTRKQEKYNFSITAENNHKIKRNEENVCVWMLDGVWWIHLND
jgi:hypothetical protein